MTFHNDGGVPTTPSVLTPEMQQAVWFLGALVRVRLGGDSTAGTLAVLEHRCERGFSSPVHRHLADEETFLVFDGELRIEVGDQTHAAGPGAVACLPRQLPHGFVVTSVQAHYLTVHTPAGFDRFTLAVGTPATGAVRPETESPDPAELAALASSYGIEIVGPPLVP